MNKPTTYQSQISRTAAGQVQILVNKKRILISKSDLYWLSQLFLTFIIALLAFYELIDILAFIVLLIISLIIYTVIIIFLPNINQSELERIFIDEQRIIYIYKKDKNNKTVFIGDEDYLDLKIRVEEDKTTVNILNETIELRRSEDLAILIDGIQEVMNLEFHDTRQLSDKTEVITYKSKKFSKIDYLTNIEIKEEDNQTFFIDIFDFKNKFSIVELEKKLVLHFLYQVDNNSIFSKSIYSNQISKIVLKLEKSKLNKNYYFTIKIHVVTTTNNESEYTVFKSSADLGELETQRSMDMVYKKLQSFNKIKNIRINYNITLSTK